MPTKRVWLTRLISWNWRLLSINMISWYLRRFTWTALFWIESSSLLFIRFSGVIVFKMVEGDGGGLIAVRDTLRACVREDVISDS